MNKNSSDDRCDLHIHSNFSDSDLEIEDIFKQAKENNLRCIALTDHDTIGGIPQARIYSKKYAVELIEAFELSVQHQDFEVHVLGYFIDVDNDQLLKELENIKLLRRQRLVEMVEVLISLGLKLDSQELVSTVGQAIPTRLHLALYLMNKGIVSSLREAFQKYLSPGKPAYRARFKHSAEAAINLIKKYQGLSFLAHPHVLPKQSWVEEFISLGIDGLEVVYPSMSYNKRTIYSNMAKKFGLLKSGGSDAHGSYKQFTSIGKTTVSYDWVKEMKDRRAVKN